MPHILHNCFGALSNIWAKVFVWSSHFFVLEFPLQRTCSFCFCFVILLQNVLGFKNNVSPLHYAFFVQQPHGLIFHWVVYLLGWWCRGSLTNFPYGDDVMVVNMERICQHSVPLGGARQNATKTSFFQQETKMCSAVIFHLVLSFQPQNLCLKQWLLHQHTHTHTQK